jgi:phosphoribosyl 1,2-cyclic phosphodiesterase
MQLFICSLNSGSNGNCYYIGSETEAVLIDAGISCREIEQRMLQAGLSIENVKAVFISHEHIDHIRGVSILSKKYQLPVYISAKTLRNSGVKIRPELLNHFGTDDSLDIGSLKVIPFSKHHDANDPYSFLIEENGIRIGVITDIGIACERVVHYFRQCHACFLESNYDEQMLEKGGYPLRLKKRIKGGKGHLSNRQALELFRHHRSAHMSHLILSHLSKNNNRPEIVQELFQNHADGINIVIASRYSESEVFSINAKRSVDQPVRNFIKRESLQLQMIFEEDCSG